MNARTLSAATGRQWRSITTTIFRATVRVHGTAYTVTAWTTPNGKMHVKADTARDTMFGLPGMTAGTIEAWKRAILAVNPTNAGYSYATNVNDADDGWTAICKALDIDHPWNR